MEKIMFDLLEQWCDKLVDLQTDDSAHMEFDGGIACPACGLIHGRCGDSMYPLVFMYEKTGNEKYLTAAKKVFDWTMNNCLVGDGVIINDVGLNSWIGITVFTQMQLGDILMHHSTVLDGVTRKKWYDAYVSQSEFVYSDEIFNTGVTPCDIKTNINYIFGKLAAMAGAYKLTGTEKYREAYESAAKFILDNFFDDDGFIFGECKPADAKSKKGYRGIDLGYNVEESLGAAAIYVCLTGDEKMKEAVIKSLRVHANFMLPDGGWDNSWSVRNAKWSYWGSRTSDGCQVAYCAFCGEIPEFSEVAYRNLMLLKKCTYGSMLYGGPMYRENGYRACIHHTFCHAKALAWVLDNGFAVHVKSELPCESEAEKGIRKFETAGLYLINTENIRATVNCYDFETVKFGHSSGGTLSLVYEKTYGPVIISGMTAYQIPEPSNMQAHRYRDGDSLTARIELVRDGRKFVSCNCFECDSALNDENTIRIRGNLEDINHNKADEYMFEYRFSDNEIQIHAECSNSDARFILPVIAGKDDPVNVSEDEIIVKNLILKSYSGIKQCNDTGRIFNLTPGFSAVKAEFGFENGEINLNLHFK